MRYEFQSKLYKTPDELCEAIASTWLSPGGHNDREQASAILAFKTNEALANDAIMGFGLDCREGHANDPEQCTWMEDRGITRENIVAAFARIRKGLDERKP